MDGDRLTAEQEKCVSIIRRWIESEAGFYGRTDEDYILMFLRSCDFDVELTKTTFTLYYEHRRKVPQWWSKREITGPDIQSVFQNKITTTLIDKDLDYPTISISFLGRYAPADSKNFDNYMKMSSVIVEAQMRRKNCQKNGVIWITDCQGHPWWLALKLLTPFIAKNVIGVFYLGLPIKIKKAIVINSPAVAFTFHKLIQPFLSQSLKERFLFLGSNWSTTIGEHVRVDLLPEEYGGRNGRMKDHDDAFLKELLSLADYISDDDKYGFK